MQDHRPSESDIRTACTVLEWCATAPTYEIPDDVVRLLGAIARGPGDEGGRVLPTGVVEESPPPAEDAIEGASTGSSTGKVALETPDDDEEAPPVAECSYHDHLRHAKDLMEETNSDDAEAHLKQALRLVPDSARARRLLSMVHEARGSKKLAHRLLAEAQSIDYDPELHERLEGLRAAASLEDECAHDESLSASERTKSPEVSAETANVNDLPIDPSSLGSLLGSDAMRNLLQNPQIMAMAQSMAADPNMRNMVDQLQQTRS
jgi:hypothetical protein